MKTLLGVLIGVFALLSIATLGLFLTGHLVLKSEANIVQVNIVDDKGNVLLKQIQHDGDLYKVIFVK